MKCHATKISSTTKNHTTSSNENKNKCVVYTTSLSPPESVLNHGPYSFPPFPIFSTSSLHYISLSTGKLNWHSLILMAAISGIPPSSSFSSLSNQTHVTFLSSLIPPTRIHPFSSTCRRRVVNLHVPPLPHPKRHHFLRFTPSSSPLTLKVSEGDALSLSPTWPFPMVRTIYILLPSLLFFFSF